MIKKGTLGNQWQSLISSPKNISSSTYLKDGEALFQAAETCSQPSLDLLGVGTAAWSCL